MEQYNSAFLQLALVLGLSTGVGFVMKQLRLPLVIAYLVTGVLLSLLSNFNVHTKEILTFLPEMGIAFVLFFVGMELDWKEIKSLGKTAAIASLGQILFSLMAGFLIAYVFGFRETESLYLGVGLAFSSTIVVVKMLLERKELTSLYGKLSIGILLIEDLVAVLILMMMTVSTSAAQLGLQSSFPLVALVVKGALLLSLSLVLSRYVLDRLFSAFAKSAELLFLSALAWCFIFVAVSLLMGFSVVIGAFLAGVALANSEFHYEIQGKVKPLRDFFVTLFFVYLGSQVVFQKISDVLPLIGIFTLYALIAKPLIFLLILGAFGFRKHTIFQTAIGLSQVSEFSLIIMVVGLQTGSVSEAALTAMALTGVISIIFSSIMISSSKWIYSRFSPFVAFFVHGNSVHQSEGTRGDLEIEDHVILVGAHRFGGEIVKFLKRERVPLLVLDFNPGIIQRLTEDKIHALYGDLGDPEILEFLNFEKAKYIISTASNLDDTLTLLSEVKRRKAQATVIARAGSVADAYTLYDAGADYVILPEIVSGNFVVETLKNHWSDASFFKSRAEIELNKLSKNSLVTE